MSRIPLSIPVLQGKEWEYVKECLDTNWLSSAGSFIGKMEDAVAQYTGASYAIATVNGTSALHMALKLVGVGQGDYVLMPNLTFVASANAIKYLGADPILVDVDPAGWQMDLDLLEEFLMNYTHINEKDELILKRDGRVIRAILPVHILGNLGDMDRLLFIAKRFQLPVVEDAAEALGSTWKGQSAGTFGEIGCLSFNGNKIITTGGGGMLLTAQDKVAEQARHLTTQAKIHPEEYDHDQVGYNYRMVNVLAAIGLAQMEQLPHLLEQRQQIGEVYREQLTPISEVVFQESLPEAKPNSWLFTIRTPRKDELLQRLKANGIQARPLWKPLRHLPMYQNCLYIQRDNHTERIYQEGVSLPSTPGLSEVDQQRVIEQIRNVHQPL